MPDNLSDIHRQIINTLINRIKEHYRNDIAIVACYGSVINGTANPKSDIDFYFIPKSDRGYELMVSHS